MSSGSSFVTLVDSFCVIRLFTPRTSLRTVIICEGVGQAGDSSRRVLPDLLAATDSIAEEEDGPISSSDVRPVALARRASARPRICPAQSQLASHTTAPRVQ